MVQEVIVQEVIVQEVIVRRSYSSNSSDSIYSDKLFELLNDNGNKDNNVFKNKLNAVPTLDELQNKGNVNDNHYIPEDNMLDDEDKKRELLFKFELLKKSYKNAEIPEFTIHTDYKTIEHTYEDTLRRLSLDSTVENYKTFLIGGFMATEYILGNFLKFNMKGFTQQQLVNMSSYERLLIELGEKSYIPKSKQWPVEVRLLFLILFNAAIFVVSNMLMKGTGGNLLNMMNNMGNNVTKKKRKMKGPEIDIDDLP